MRVTATYQGRDRRGHYILTDVRGHMRRDHAFINGVYNSLPEIPLGARIRFFASAYWRRGEMKLSDVREVEVL